MNMNKIYTYNEGDKFFTFILHLQSIRYSKRNAFHAYGRQTSFMLTFVNPSGVRMRKFFSDIGTCQRAAFSNALRTLSIYR
jgi:hypothetical protein